MKVMYMTIFSLTCLAAVYALPARPQDTEEIEFVPLEDQGGRHPVIDTGVIGGPFSNPFDGLFDSFAAMMARLRQQMDYLLGRLPTGNATIGSAFPVIPDIDLSKAKNTSVTKVIDGHKVVINETELREDGELGGSYFKVRIIDVLPDSSELTTEQNAESLPTGPKDVESVESSQENEISKNREPEVFSNLESFDEPDNYIAYSSFPERNWESVEPFATIEDNSVDYVYPPRDLSRDTYVNKMMADAGAPTNPDAEVFSSVESNIPPYLAKRIIPFEKITSPR